MSQHDRYISPFSTRYSSDEMQYIFSDDNKFRTWRRLWVALAVLFLVPVRALLPQAPAAVTVSAQPFYTQMTALTEETTTKPDANVPYRTTTADDNTMHYIVPRAELQTGRRTVLERLAIDTN